MPFSKAEEAYPQPIASQSPFKNTFSKMTKKGETYQSLSTQAASPQVGFGKSSTILQTRKHTEINTGRWSKEEHDLFMEGI